MLAERTLGSLVHYASTPSNDATHSSSSLIVGPVVLSGIESEAGEIFQYFSLLYAAIQRPNQQSALAKQFDGEYTVRQHTQPQWNTHANTITQNAIHNHAVRQTASIRQKLTAFETDPSPSLQGSIAAGITQLIKTVDEYEGFVKKETDDDKLQKASLKLSAFRQDVGQFKRRFQELKRLREEATHEFNRSELLNRRPQASDNPYENQQSAQAQPMAYREGLQREHNTLERGNIQLDQILAMGQESFEELVASNQIIQQIGQKLTGTLGTLGMSQGTIRLIERRAKEDKYVFWGCMIVFFVCCYYIYKWFG